MSTTEEFNKTMYKSILPKQYPGIIKAKSLYHPLALKKAGGGNSLGAHWEQPRGEDLTVQPSAGDPPTHGDSAARGTEDWRPELICPPASNPLLVSPADWPQLKARGRENRGQRWREVVLKTQTETSKYHTLQVTARKEIIHTLHNLNKLANIL